MGTSLTGKTIASSYSGLIKTTDNSTLNGSAKVLTDGTGTNSALYLSTTQVGIGINPTQALHISGNMRLTGAIYDSNNSTGTSGQVLTSTGSATDWMDNAGGDISGTGTSGTLTKFTGTKTIGDSIMTESGTEITLTGSLALSSYITLDNNKGIKGKNTSGTAISLIRMDSNDVVSIDFQSQGTSFGGNISLITDKKIYLGSSNESEIYHTASSFRIKTDNSSNLRIDSGSNIQLRTANNDVSASNENILGYHNNNNWFTISGADPTPVGSGAGQTGYDLHISNIAVDKDIIFQGNDNGTLVTAMTLDMSEGGKVKFNAYGSGTVSGTEAYRLGVDSSGNVIEITDGGGTITGSGTIGTIPKFTGTSALGDSIVTETTDLITIAGTINVNSEEGTSGVGVLGLKIYDTQHETSNTGGIISFSSNRNTTTNEIERVQIGGFAESGTAGSEEGYFKVSTMNSSGTMTEAFRLNADQSALFAGTVTTSDVYGTSSLRLAALGGIAYLDSGSGYSVIIRTNGTTPALTLDSSQNATFEGTIGSGAITSTGRVTGTQGYFGDTFMKTDGGYAVFGSDSSSVPIAISIDAVASTAALKIETNNNATFAGNVGIGTTTPGSKLNIETTKTVALSTAADFLTLGLIVDDTTAYSTEGGGGGIAFRSKRNSSGTQTVYAAIDGAKEGTANDGYTGALRFYTNQNSTGVPLERMRIDSSGNVGIGTTSPEALLEVGSITSSGAQYISIDGAATQEAGIQIRSAGTIEWYIYRPPSSDDLRFYNGNDKVFFKADGKVGINETSPDNLLHVTTATGQSARFEATGQYTSLIEFKSLGTAVLPAVGAAGDDYVVYTNTGERMRIGSTGNTTFEGTVSISTATTYPLTVKSTDADAADIFRVLADDDGLVASVHKDASDNGELYVWSGAGGANIQLFGGTGNATFAGNVGINTTTSAAKNLVVEGNASEYATIRVLSNSTGHGSEIEFGDSTDADYGSITQFASSAGEGGRMRFRAGGTEIMNVKPVGVAILGAAASGAALVTIENNSGSTATSYGLLVKGGGNSSSGKTFEVRDDSGNTDLIVQGAGNVGIGTDDPEGYKLYVQNSSEDLLKLYNSSDGLDALISFANAGGTLARIQGIDNGGLAFDTGNNAGGINSNAMFIDNDGQVGIGTTNPSYPLVVSNDGAGGIEFVPAASTGMQEILSYNRSSSAYEKLRFSTLSYEFYTSTVSNALVILNNGNVYAGTTTPAYSSAKIVSEFNGVSNNGILISDTSSTGVNNMILFAKNGSEVGTVTSSTSATNYNTSSDYRLKENVVSMTDALDRVSQLKPSRFNFIADSDKTVDGFLAHEVQEIVPEAITGEKDAVDEEGNLEYQGIDQSKLVPLLVGAIQELKAEIDELKKNK